MPRKHDDFLRNLNVPWLTKDGHVDLAKLPIEATLAQALSREPGEYRSACYSLGSIASAGRTEAAIFLCGLLRYCVGDMAKREVVAKALGQVHTKECARVLFEELERTESSNTTRVFIKTILKAVAGFPPELVQDRLMELRADPKWSYRMKRNFEDILDEINYRSREASRLRSRLTESPGSGQLTDDSV